MTLPLLTAEDLLEIAAEQIETRQGDNGIGAYEHFGARGIDIQPYTEIITEHIQVDVTDYAHGYTNEDEPELPNHVGGEQDGANFTLVLDKVTGGVKAIAIYDVIAGD